MTLNLKRYFPSNSIRVSIAFFNTVITFGQQNYFIRFHRNPGYDTHRVTEGSGESFYCIDLGYDLVIKQKWIICCFLRFTKII
jgi:hypothetical protein